MEEFLSLVLSYILEYAILLFEFIGTIVLIYTGIRGLIQCVRKKPIAKLNLARGMTLGLMVLLVGEILHTVTAHELSDILTIGGIIVLRVALTVLINWETKHLEIEYEHDMAAEESGRAMLEEQHSEQTVEDSTENNG